LRPPLAVSHDVVFVVLHAHPVVVVTEPSALPPPAAIVCDVGVTTYAQAAPACVTLCPTTVGVPVRGVVCGFAETVNARNPFPLPGLPAVILSHDRLLEADHAQPLGAVTATLTGLSLAGTSCEPGETRYVHDEPAAYVTVTIWPATVNRAVRGVTRGLAAAANDRYPCPLPGVPAVTCNQDGLSLAADQAHPAGAVTSRLLALALPGRVSDVGVTVYPHDTPAWSIDTVRPATVIAPFRGVASAFGATL